MEPKVRLDVYVASQLSETPRTYAHKLISEGKVLVNGKTTKASYHIKPTDKVKIDSRAAKVKIPKISLQIIYEDNSCVVINKPSGLLTHSKGDFNPEPTVATWLNNNLKKKQENRQTLFPGYDPGNPQASGNRDGIVHRLDRATSGVMICAKTDESLKWLQKQFSTRKVKKTYLALIEGELKPSAAVIDMPIGRNPKTPQKFRVDPSGKPAVTEYKSLKTLTVKNATYSQLELRPTTGRTHQLRVHLAHLKHPIVGDTLYGGAEADRLYLHAKELEIVLPSKKRQTFTSELPNNFDGLNL